MPPQPPLTNEQNEIKKRAIRRVIIASVLVAAAIAGLTVLSRYKFEPSVTQTTSQGTVLPPVKIDEPVEPPPPEETVAPTIEPPVQEELPVALPPPPPAPVVVSGPTPISPVAPASKMAKQPATKFGVEVESSARPSPVRNSLAPVPATTPVIPTPRATQELVPIQPIKTTTKEALQPIKEALPPTVASTPIKVPEAPPKAYSVQLGAFSNLTNAQQLQERLTQNGIKSYTETKLNVGPFQSRAEADQALAKMRAMGLSAVIVPIK